MLKGILFIVLIIITFDIGKYFIDKKRVQEAAEVEVQKEQQINAQHVEAEVIPEEEPVQVLIDLTLPEDVLLKEETLEQYPVQEDLEKSELIDFVNSAGTEDKQVSVRGKPIITFDEEINDKPRIEGVDVGVTIKID